MKIISCYTFIFHISVILCILIRSSLAAAQNESDSALVKLLINQNGALSECKGVAVAQRTILTSAHCLENKLPSAIEVVSKEKKLEIIDFNLHPGFHTKDRLPKFDIALLTTNEVITDNPLPIIINTRLAYGEHFSMLNLPHQSNISNQAPKFDHTSEMVVADLESTILKYIELKRGSFPNPEAVNELEIRLKSGDPKIKEKILDEFGGYIISLYSDSKDSICLGESGSPALVTKDGQPGVIGLATAVSNLESEQNPDCPEGGTSIFTSLNQKETILFIRTFNPEIEFK